jgi:Transposase DDE domain
LSEEHFSVDETLIDAWASLKSFRPKDEGGQGPKDRNGWGDFSGQSRSNHTCESTTDPQAKLLKKGPGKEAKLCFTGHAVMENRHGFCVSFELTPSVGVTETEQIFGWMKTVGGMRRSRYCGAERTDAACKWVVAALNLLRLAKLNVSPPQAVVRA